MRTLLDELEAAGYDSSALPPNLVTGQVYRLPAPGKRASNRSGWVIIHSDNAATYGDWATSEQNDWFSNSQHAVSVAKPVAKPVKNEERAKATNRARWIWEHSTQARVDHPYLEIKQISADGIRQNRADCLVVPIYDSASETAELINLQFITSDGSKRFLKGARKAGGYCRLPGELPRIFVEGLATGKTIHAATRREVIITFDAGNLVKVAANMAQPGDVVGADNDNGEKPGTLFNKRLTHYGTGHKRAAETGLPYYMPPVPGADFNDIGEKPAAEVFSAGPISKTPIFDAWKITPISIGQADDKKLAKLLSQTTEPAGAAALARSVADRLSMRSPAGISLIQIRAFIESNTPQGLINPITLDGIVERLTYAQHYRKSAALDAVRIPEHDKKRHAVEEVRELPSLSPDDYQGVIVVRAPMASGKTSVLGASFARWADKQQLGFLGICHRVSLTLEMAKKLGAEHYQEVMRESAPFVGAMVTCLPSIMKPDHHQIISNSGYIFIDEISQVLRFLRDSQSCSVGDKSNQDIYDKLREIVTAARCLIVADAGIDRRTIEFLESCRPGERFRVIEMEQKRESIAAEYTVGGQATEIVVGDCLAELAAGGKIWLASESKDRAKVLGDFFQAQGYRTLTVTAATKGNRAQQLFLENIEKESRRYDVVIASPTISSGVSIEHREQAPHFTLGAFVGSGIRVTPADAAQMLRRVRYLRRYVIGFLPNNQIGNQSSEALIRSMEAAARVEGEQSSASQFDSFIADIKASEDNHRADFAAGLLWLLDAQKWQLTAHSKNQNGSISAQLKIAKQSTEDVKREALKNARRIDEDEAKRLQYLPERTEQQNLLLAAYRLRKALNVSVIDDATLDFWDDGRCVATLDRFSVYNGIAPAFDESSQALSSRRYWKACARAYQYLLADIEIEHGHWISESTAGIIIERMLKQRHLLSYLGIIPKKFGTWKVIKGELQSITEVKYPVRELQAILAKMGLKTRGKQVRNVHRSHSYFINENRGSVYNTPKRGRAYEITPESWREIESWATKRNAGRLVQSVRPRSMFKLKPVTCVRIGSAYAELQRKVDDAFIELAELPTGMTIKEALAA